MNSGKCERNSRRKKEIRNEIKLSNEKDKIIMTGSDKSTSMNIQNNKKKKLTEISTKLMTKVDKIENLSDKNQSILQMSVKMNNYFDNNEEKKVSIDNINCSTNGNSKSEKANNICNSCKGNSNKVIKCKATETQFHVSIKTKRPLYCQKSESKERLDHDEYVDKRHLIHSQHNNCSVTSIEKMKILKLDFLIQFLDQMRHKVITRELSFDTFRTISQRLLKDKMEMELLLLTEITIRAQIIQMTALISKDLCQNKITPLLFVNSFLKQYQLLKSLSLVYKQILDDYESTFLTMHNLSFDLISRAYFKLIMCGYPEFKEHILSGHLNVKLDCLYDHTMTNTEKDRIKLNYLTLKSDFQDSNKWKEIDKTIRNILCEPKNVVKSLSNYFNMHFASCFCRSAQCKKECCNDRDWLSSDNKEDGYLEILRILVDLPKKDACSISLQSPDSLEYLLRNNNNNNYKFEIQKSKCYKSSMTTTCRTIYRTLENIKPPSISCSSSSNNSNGYNSCISISSYEESSDDDDDKEERFFQKWKRGEDVDMTLPRKEETKPPTPVSYMEEDNIASNSDNQFSEYNRHIFRTKDRCCSQDDIDKFNQLYNQYLAENEYLLDQATMSVPDYLSTLEKADNLQSIIKTLMTNSKKDIDIHEKRCSPHSLNLTDLDTDNMNCSPSTERKYPHLDMLQLKDDEFDLDIDELSKKFGVGPPTQESLEEFEKFLEEKLENNGNAHPNLEALVKTYRIYCNKLYKSGWKEEQNKKEIESDSSGTGRNIHSRDSKQTVSGDESFDIPCDCLPAVNIEDHENCSPNNNVNAHSNNNMSSSETGSSSASTENTGANKVCNCCKCEMFGEQNIPSRGANVVEKLRLTLQKRKQCQQKNQRNCSKVQICENNKLPDVDTLVEFINGPDKTSDVQLHTPDMGRSFSKKNKTKSKVKSKKAIKCAEGMELTDHLNKADNIVRKELDVLSVVCLISEKLSQNNKEVRDAFPIDNNNELKKAKDFCETEDEVLEKEIYDPVVEDFKKFCSNVVVPKHRKKLSLGEPLLIDKKKIETEKKQEGLDKGSDPTLHRP